MIHGTRPLLFAALCAGAAACDKGDVGKVCGTEASTLPSDPIVGEEPVPEIVRMERDGACESFLCLRHAGLEPYCTRRCEEVAPKKAKDCGTSSDCEDSDYCSEGRCVEDDCPNGFWCRVVQEVGPVAGERFCVRQDDCQRNADCDDLPELRCDRLGCFDACLRAGTTCSADVACPQGLSCNLTQGRCECAYSQLVCAIETELPCECPGGGLACDDRELACSLGDTNPVWPAGSVSRTGYCFHREQPE